jgi:arylsulfatase A-like enzyme
MRQNRRTFLAGAAAASAMATNPAIAGRQRSDKPNILFIMADDLGYADIGVYGQRYVGTPNIDMLAKDGLKLTQGYANSCVCSPTRVALATGMYQQRFTAGLDEPILLSAPDDVGLPHDQPTIASILRDQGYFTALIGKWHIGEPPIHGPLQHGYDYFFGFPKGAMDYFSHRSDLTEVKPEDGLYLGDDTVKRNGYLTRLFADEAISVIRNAQPSKPFLISLHFNAPHWPWEGPHDEEVSANLKSIFHYEGGSLETYAAMIASMDANIGRVLGALAESGAAENTIVVFTSDNGGERYSDTWPFVGVKGELLEGGIRVPLIVRWPARIASGSVSDQVMTSMDFAPTFLSAGGGNPKKFEFDGDDLLDVLTGEKKVRERTLFWRMKANDQAAVRSGNWKYLKIAEKEHLFNVVDDPRERAEKKDVFPDKFNMLKQAYDDWNDGMLAYSEENFSSDTRKTFTDRF